MLALDVGERRVGIAISDPSGTLARPLGTIPQHPRPEHFATVRRLVAEQAVSLVVVGLPISLNGTEGPQARRIERYERALAAELAVPVVSWDERYSTAVAMELLDQAAESRGRRASGRRRSTRGDRDSVAAAVILQRFLDSRRASPCGEDRHD